VTSDLREQIQHLMEQGTHRLSAQGAVGRQSARPGTFPYNRSRGHARLVAAGAGVAAVACAGALTATQLTGSPATVARARGHKTEAVLTAATLRHLASVSRLALAHSGRAVVHSRTAEDGAVQSTGTDVITFDGRDWNDSFTEDLPGIGDSRPAAQSAINRVVNGQAYDYFVADQGKRWYHVTGPDAVSSMNIPDPRKLLAELAPAARFVVAGHAVLNGVAVTRLVATDPAALPELDNVQFWPAGTITAATVWVDASGVVRQLSLSGTRQVHGVIGPKFEKERKLLQKMFAQIRQLESTRHLSVTAARRVIANSPLGRELNKDGIFSPQLISVSTSVTVSFTDIGKPQVIMAPAGAITISAVG
jgi:hypothetical protein